jgi:hypothetical protein
VIDDRYTVGGLEGFRFMHHTPYIPNDRVSSSRRPMSTWYVYDRYRGYKVIDVFAIRLLYSGPPTFNVRKISPEQQARSKARKLNRQWRRRQPGLT